MLREIRGEKEAQMASSKNRNPTIRETENGKEKWCPACQDYHPATEEYFYTDNNSATGFASWCKQATLDKQKASRKKKAKADSPAESGGTAPNVSLVLDFSEDQELFGILIQEAKRDRRDPAQQVMWRLEQQLSESEA